MTDKFAPIIGSGTIGNYLGYLLAKQGFDVRLYEEHDKIGEPCHCTGILTSGLLDIVAVPNRLILNKLEKVKVIGPDGCYSMLKSKDIVLDRIGFDVYLSELAADNGANIEFSHKFEDFHDGRLRLRHKNNIKNVNCDKVISADGPASRLFHLLNPNIKRRYWIGVQAVVKKDFDKDVYEAYLGNHIAPGFFAWVVPMSEEKAVIGLAVKDNPHNYFDKFMKKRLGEKYKSSIISYRGGLIPRYDPDILCQKNNVYLIGDAAGHVKATTGGGIIPGMKAAKALASSLATGRSYEKLWRRYIAANLWNHLRIRQMLDKFSDKDYNYLVSLMNKDKTSMVMAESDREYPGKFLFKMLVAEPRFLYFIKHLF